MNQDFRTSVNAGSAKSLLCLASAAALGLALAGCATSEKSLVEQGAKPLSESALQAEFSRPRKTNWTTANGVGGISHFTSDGKVSANWGSGSAEGRFRVHQAMLCTTFKDFAAGAERCSRVYRTGDNRYRSFLADGTPGSTFSFAE